MLLSAQLKSDWVDRDRTQKKEGYITADLLDAGYELGWQKYGGRGTLVIPMKSFSRAAEESSTEEMRSYSL